MKKQLMISFITFQLIYSHAQTIKSGHGEYIFNSEKKACLTENQYSQIWGDIKTSQKKLKAEGKLNLLPLSKLPPKFIWPVQKSSSAPYENAWSISAHVDHNPLYPNQLLDWNCGSRTYDTADGYNHQGIDIFLWPFPQYQQEHNQAEIVAAAEGTIIYKSDGNYDRNCSLSGGDWNAVYIQHSDGSVAWYGHMKKNSLTNKPIGSTVTAGEYLGIVGSSGNSTGPHLHFEVYNVNNQLIETYQGSCNNFASGNNSWWENQKPYQDPKINAVLTHSNIPNFNTACPDIEEPFIKNNFGNGEMVYGIVYLADQLPGTNFTLNLIRPDNSIAANRLGNINIFYTASYFWWSFPSNLFNTNGEWKLEVTYQGKTVVHKFNYGEKLSVENNQSKTISIYPNPVKSEININNLSNEKIENLSIYDISGKLLLSYKNPEASKFNVSQLTKGVYNIILNTNKNIYKQKFIKE
ncbi:peptidoglycan DD-metalloendopeptidase family protein [Chryseobacterium sp. POL2]|uniref:peptidoglycan DD-metalloendopeptidase family protein n=1 Tax=Chryseobacterium sp. POL2 TaxID=2713414 RepID=UPI0013E16682|nr:peptidoglycan DD-metalloendopeptidase family protein [Chryseobacterium sp. POL2]QIG90737.1 peptidoglycan DD-metalloendopeptidase family protein [Chryseobacterium sp. POL2]